MSQEVPAAVHRSGLHRSTTVVLVVALVATVAGALLAGAVVRRSEQRLLEQKAGAAGIVMSSLLEQSFPPAIQSLGAALGPGGHINAPGFAAISAALRAPEPTKPGQRGGLGLAGTALIDLTHQAVLAQSGPLLLDLRRQARMLAAAVAVASADSSKTAFVGLLGKGTHRTLGILSVVGPGLAGYVEMPFMSTVEVDALKLSPQYAKAFGDLDFAIYFGLPSASNLLWTNVASRHLTGRSAQVAVGLGDASNLGVTFDAHRRPLTILVSSRVPLTGTFAQAFPWVMLAFGLISGLIVMLLTETTNRRRDAAYLLVRELEERNAEVERAVARQSAAEERLRRAQRMEAVGQLAGGIAHDFNNLLAVIFSYSGFLKVSAAGQPWAEDVEEIEKAARRAGDLTKQLLMFSRSDAEHSSVVDLTALLRDRAKLLQRTLGGDIEVQVSLPDEPLNVRADAVELDQVVMNLAVNARDAMPTGGVLSLALRRCAGPEGSPAVELVVADTGTGMPPEVTDRAMEPFFTTKEVGRGTGLGLATVYGIVRRCAGCVTIRSRVGEGTSVTVLLPLSDAEVTGPVVVPAPRPATANTGTVLLVEDEESVRRASSRILQEVGYTVIEAASGPEALTRYDQQHVDVLVTDVVMPGGMSGVDLAEQLRERQPDLCLVVASGHSRDLISRRGPLPAGTRLLNKPFPATTLVDAVQDALAKQKVPS